MITFASGGAHTLHTFERNGEHGLCRRNITPGDAPVYGADGRVTHHAPRIGYDESVNCKPCALRLELEVNRAWNEAHAEQSRRLDQAHAAALAVAALVESMGETADKVRVATAHAYETVVQAMRDAVAAGLVRRVGDGVELTDHGLRAAGVDTVDLAPGLSYRDEGLVAGTAHMLSEGRGSAIVNLSDGSRAWTPVDREGEFERASRRAPEAAWERPAPVAREITAGHRDRETSTGDPLAMRVSVWNPDTRCFEAIEFGAMPPADERDLSAATVTAGDLGCEPGTRVLIEFLDAEDHVVDDVELIAEDPSDRPVTCDRGQFSRETGVCMRCGKAPEAHASAIRADDALLDALGGREGEGAAVLEPIAELLHGLRADVDADPLVVSTELDSTRASEVARGMLGHNPSSLARASSRIVDGIRSLRHQQQQQRSAPCGGHAGVFDPGAGSDQTGAIATCAQCRWTGLPRARMDHAQADANRHNADSGHLVYGAYSADQILGIGGSEWRNRARTMHRVYLNDAPLWAGLNVERDGTGNISSATLDGHRISNRHAQTLLMDARVYLDVPTMSIVTNIQDEFDRVVVGGRDGLYFERRMLGALATKVSEWEDAGRPSRG